MFTRLVKGKPSMFTWLVKSKPSMFTRLVKSKCMLPSGASASDPERHSGPKKKKSRAEAAPANDASSAADLSSAQKAVKGTLKLKAAGPFSAPVSEEDVPGYSSVIQNPMDLGSIAEKLKNGEYATTGRRQTEESFVLSVRPTAPPPPLPQEGLLWLS